MSDTVSINNKRVNGIAQEYICQHGTSRFVRDYNHIEMTEVLCDSDFIWGHANREQIFGIAKSTMERIVIDNIDDLQNVMVVFTVFTDVKDSHTAEQFQTEWIESTADHDLMKHAAPVMSEQKGVEDEDR